MHTHAVARCRCLCLQRLLQGSPLPSTQSAQLHAASSTKAHRLSCAGAGPDPDTRGGAVMNGARDISGTHEQNVVEMFRLLQV